MKRLRFLVSCFLLGYVLGACCMLTEAQNATSEKSSEYMEQIEFLEHLLNLTYDKRIRPQFTEGKPTVVTVDILLSSITDINAAAMEFGINFYLRQMWKEPRLAHPNATNDKMLTLSESQRNHIWVPDLFFSNEKKSSFHTITLPNLMIRISPKGDVLYSQRLSATLNCEFDLVKFPMDNQTCRIKMESYAHSTTDLIFKWVDRVQYDETLDNTLPEFELDGISTGDCTAVYSTGSFTCLYMDLHVTRDLRYYILNVYLPSVIVVLLSFVNFWIDATAVPARTTVGIVTILTVTTQSVTLQDRLPKVSYIKAIDVWLSVCLVFVVGSMLEYAVVNVMLQRERRHKEKIAHQSLNRLSSNGDISKDTQKDQSITPVESQFEKEELSDRLSTIQSANYEHKQTPSEKVDYVSRIAFPVLFFSFNIVYWLVYLTSI
ncbi:glycine receptor subunit alpha-3 isoform X1 [Lingula anatina]|uniref:Gamma-aminobutyric acid receptor subunit beta n=2 Tax=Lingula anatina TaxID=7574 RepID=A0A1S3I393_LINAN|nr:glycine receptor subunit alpha-3 isoform X1 [Lingula anatina]|eukprot:XP_013391819.1 glycine receptor subunit alpha-3 isoform X1 [Lingula anatina]